MKISVKNRPLQPNELGGLGDKWATCFYDSQTYEIYGYIGFFKNSVSFIAPKKTISLETLKEIIKKYEEN